VSRVQSGLLLGASVILSFGCEGAPGEQAPGSAQLRIDANAQVVISQVYGGGGNNLAPFKNDFVELFNRSVAPVSLVNLSLQYASATGSGNFAANPVVALSGTLQPGQHYLIQLGGGATGATLPAPDATASTNMSATAGKVALVNSPTGLPCNSTANCSASDLARIIDVVGFGTQTAPINEGAAAAPTLSNATAAVRADNGCTDTNQNGNDFSAGAPNPRNTAAAVTLCFTGNVAPQVSSTAPANGAANVGPASNITINFSEPVTASGSWFSISCSLSGNVSAAVSGGPQSYVLDPTVDLQSAENCSVSLVAASVIDAEGLAMTSDFVFAFSTATPVSGTPIHTIQGSSHISPLKDAQVTVRGIVTGVDSNGYFLQDPAPDADPATSEGLFIFTSTAPSVAVGDDVQVSGKVAEFRASSDTANLTQTELTTPTEQAVLAQGQPLPAPVVLGQGGRVPPSSVIEDDAVGDVETVTGTFDVASDGLDFYESLEGMRVQVNDALAVGPTVTVTGGIKELATLVDNGAGASVRTNRGGIVVSASDFNPERVTLTSDLGALIPLANVGDRLPGVTTGVISYALGGPKLFVTQPLPALVAGGLGRELTMLSAPRPSELDIAAFNVENLDPNDAQDKFDRLAGILVESLRSPDIVALEEIQDNDGATNSAVVDSTTTLNKLVAAISAANAAVTPKPVYAFALVNPVDDQDGGEPGGNIRVAFLYRTDRGLTFFNNPGGSTTANDVTGSGASTALQFSPGRIDPTNSVFSASRKPLAGQFEFSGKRFFVIANHFNSKGGDDPLFGRFQPPVLDSEAKRDSQATVVKTFVTKLLTADPLAEVVVLGDLNDFEFAKPLLTLKSAGLSDLIEGLPLPERYTYVYQGNSQALDHILVSSSLTAHVVKYDILHVNAEFSDQASDHDPGVARISFDRTPPVVTVPAVSPVVNASSPNGAVVTFSVSATDAQDGTPPVSCVPASGSTFPVGVSTVTCTATDAGGNVTRVDFPVTVKAVASGVPAAPLALLGALATALLALGKRRLKD
jgi:predicted extracellular nuclease